jgi:NADH-quinone oxidoreductase subunit L
MWQPGRWPFVLAAVCTLLTAFYMTRQVCLVFFGVYRGGRQNKTNSTKPASVQEDDQAANHPSHEDAKPHESPHVMTVPLIVLAVMAVALGFIGTPLWPWVQTFLTGHHETVAWGSVILVMLISVILVFTGMLLGGFFYGVLSPRSPDDSDPLDQLLPAVFSVWRDRFYIDELYEATVVRASGRFSTLCYWIDSMVLQAAVALISYLILGVSWVSRVADEYAINLGFNQACERVRRGGASLSRIQDGKVQHYLRVIGVALIAFLLLLIWGWAK